jgi:hypothetical protein
VFQQVESASPANLQKVRFFKLASVTTISQSAVLLCSILSCAASGGQQIDNATAVRNIDAAVKARIDHIAGYTDIEHYKVFRGQDSSQPAAEMVVETTYQPASGKNYQVLSHRGSTILYKFLLQPILASETDINNPQKVASALMVSANYDMQLKPGGPVQQDGRACWMLAIVPRRKAANLIQGTLWVDAHDFTIVHIDGVTSKSPSFWAAPAHVMRQYVEIDGFPEAIHARAESDSFFGKAVVTIDYEGYQIQSR